MATVYLADDLKHERKVALKVLKPELAAVVGAERFLAEIKTTANLTHPHILPLFDSGEAESFLYYVMPYVEGESLSDKLKRERQLSVEQSIEIAEHVATALDYAHRTGVIHRDIKPENILLQDGQPVIADFGIALAVTQAGGDRLTETGFSLGTPAYMSPEQASGEEVDGRSDLYSLGAVLHEMLAGTPPFTGPTAESVAQQHMTAEAPSVVTIRPGVPGEVASAVQRALAKAAADRFTTAARFAEALKAGAAGARLPSAARKRPVPIPLLVMGIVVVVVAGALAVWFRASPSAPAVGHPRLVVLPFENLGAPDDEYFADGITEEITSRLARLSGLDVIARTSAMHYKVTDKTAKQIGE